MKKFKVTITETLKRDFIIEAENEEYAEIRIADLRKKETEKYSLNKDNSEYHIKYETENYIPYQINEYDRKVAFVTAVLILDACGYNLTTTAGFFDLECQTDDDHYIQHTSNLYDLFEKNSKIFDMLYDAFENRKAAGEEIKNDDWDRMILILLNSEFFKCVLSTIDIEWYELNLSFIAYHFMHLKDYKNRNNYEKHLVDKTIALKVIGTQELYHICELSGLIYLAYGLDYKDNAEFERALRQHTGYVESETYYSFCKPTYAEVIEAEMEQIQQDIYDLGADDMYLTLNELEYIGANLSGFTEEELEKINI